MMNGQGAHSPGDPGSQRDSRDDSASDATTDKLIAELAGLLRDSQQTPHSQQGRHLHQPMPLPPLPAGVAARQEDSFGPGPLPVLPPATPLRVEDDEATVPIPSTWLSQPPEAPPRWLGEQMRAAVLGFAVGLLVVLPVVLLLTGKFGAMPWSEGPSARPQASAPTAAARPTGTLVEDVARQTAGAPIETPAAKREQAKSQAEASAPPTVQASAQPSGRVLDPIRSLMNEGQKLVAAGNIPEAREVLSRAAQAGTPEVTLALAETYDPNMLAAWGVRDVKADADTARKLYRKALDGGIEKARVRLDALH